MSHYLLIILGCNKYSPKKISDITCNNKAIKTICDWLKSYNDIKISELEKIKVNNQKKKRGRAW